MGKSHKVMVIYFFFLVLVLIHPESAAIQDECIESRCSKHGAIIRFPFRLKDKHPDFCGFPGFELSCVRNKHTLLELPNSVKLYVRKIDYQSKLLHLYDPDKCLLKSLANLSLPSTFSFHFYRTYPFNNYTLFNCKSFYSKFRYNFEVSCFKYANDYKVYAVDSTFRMQYATFSSCTKMHDILSVPGNIDNSNDLLLSWRKPECNRCEVARMKCKLKSNSTIETECYGALLKNVKGERAKVLIGVSIPGSVVLSLVVIVLWLMYRADRKDKENQAKIEKFLEDYKAFRPARYSYADIKRITDNFKHKLGQGNYGTVFKGKLAEISVAIKMLNDSKGNGEEFINEVGTMGQIHHVNVVRLVGFCADGFIRALVYEFLPNQSLDKFIFSTNRDNHNHILGWDKLLDIAVGVAKGIEYLHQGCEQRILHFDIKPQNVLLDQNFNPKIADFGLAKLCSKDQSAVSMTTARGTVGYIAPEVLSRNFGNVSYKSDVYSFGKLLLEMVGGGKNSDPTAEDSSLLDFPEWVYNRLEQGEDIRIQIDEEGDANIMKKLTMVGMWCIQWNPIDRPSMKVVVQMLEGGGDDLPMPPNPFASTGNKRVHGTVPGRRLHQELDVISEAEAE